MKTLHAFLFSSVLFIVSLHAQKAPIKWGKVSKSDLKMTTYDTDPYAEAVVLADYGTLEFDLTTGDYLYVFKHHIRIKLFKKSAFERGDISIPYYAYQKSEKIYDIKAQVFLPNGEEVSLSKKDIFDEKINKYWSQKKFAFPALEEGCIIEYKYTKKSDLIYYLTDWVFQSDIPTRISDFRTEIPEWFNYISFNQGLQPQVDIEEISKSLKLPSSTPGTMTNSRLRRRERSRGSVGNNSVEAVVRRKRYYMENVPALKPEKFITTMGDYYAKLSLQLQYLTFPDQPTRDVTGTWAKEAEELINSESFGFQFNKKRFTKKLMAAVAPSLENANTPEEQVQTIYNFISTNIVWNKYYGYSSLSLDDAFEKKSAKSGELNLMLIALCRQLDINAYPVLISTRNHGRPMEHYPKSDQFNHVIAYVQIAERSYLFDVGSPYRPASLLRNNSLNYKGWLVDKELQQWIDIPIPSDREVTMATLILDSEGTLKGDVSQSFKGYCAIGVRNEYMDNKDNDHQHIKEVWQETFPDIKINSVGFENVEKISETLKCKLQVDIPEAAQVAGDMIYLSPMLGQGFEENPLKQETRTFPVDIPVKSKDQYILNLTIPEGYSVEELPENINLKMDGNGGQFQYLVSQNGNTIQVVCKVTISKVRFEPEEYNIIKGFFDVIVEKQGEQIVLKKIT